jgi:CRP/FNR family cyclic AMP-dependent transcriptional regulator
MKKKILLIEDDRITRENTAEILEFANYEILQASDGKEGVKLARTHKPDVIVCDVVLPKLDGFGIYQVLSTDPGFEQIPFIFLSCKNSHEDIRKGMALGADDYITKPFEESELLSAIATRIKKSEKNKLEKDFTSDDVIYENMTDLIKSFHDRDVHHFSKNDVIYCEGNYSSFLYLIKKGSVKTYKNTEEGKELITGFYYPQQFLGYISLFGGIPHTENAMAMEDLKIIKIEKSEIFELLKTHPHLTLSILSFLANKFKDSKDRMLQMAYDSVRGRLAKTLLVLTSHHPNQSINISRSDLANLAGIAKETLIRTLSDFKDSQWIEIDKNQIKILNIKSLSSIN